MNWSLVVINHKEQSLRCEAEAVRSIKLELSFLASEQTIKIKITDLNNKTINFNCGQLIQSINWKNN